MERIIDIKNAFAIKYCILISADDLNLLLMIVAYIFASTFSEDNISSILFPGYSAYSVCFLIWAVIFSYEWSGELNS